jgi:hypothetical protein
MTPFRQRPRPSPPAKAVLSTPEPQQPSDARGLLLALLATGSQPLEAGHALADAVGWRQGLDAITQTLAGDPIAHIRALAGIADRAAARPGPDRRNLLVTLEQLGIHPLAVALGLWCGTGTQVERERAAVRARGLGRRLEVDPSLVRLSWNQGLEANLWPTSVKTWPKGLAFVPANLCGRGHWSRIPLPDGLSVAGDLDLGGSSVVNLPENLRVEGNLSLMDCPRWDHQIPLSAHIGGRIHATGSIVNDRGLTLDQWRRYEALKDQELATGLSLVRAELWAARQLRDDPGWTP